MAAAEPTSSAEENVFMVADDMRNDLVISTLLTNSNTRK